MSVFYPHSSTSDVDVLEPEFRSMNLITKPLTVDCGEPTELKNVQSCVDSPWLAKRNEHTKSSNRNSYYNTISANGTLKQNCLGEAIIGSSDAYQKNCIRKYDVGGVKKKNDALMFHFSLESGIHDYCYGWTNGTIACQSIFQLKSRYSAEIKINANAEGTTPATTSQCTNSLENVINALYNMFREQSLHVIFTSEPTAIARCEAPSGLVFNIFFWRPSKSCTTTSPDAIYLVEVDFVSGCSILFHGRYAKLVLETVNTAAAGTPPTPRRAVLGSNCNIEESPASSTEFEIIDSLFQGFTDNVREESFQTALERAAEMLARSNRYDMVLQGLEMLEHLTNPTHCGWNTASRASCIVLLGRDSAESNSLPSVNKNRSVQQSIRQAIRSMALLGSSSCNTEATLVRKSLSIVAQSIVLLKPVEVRTFMRFSVDKEVVDGLFRHVYLAHTSPYMAELATNILTVLVRHEEVVTVDDADMVYCGASVPPPSVTEMCRNNSEQIHIAHTFGSYHHLGLERATGKLLLAGAT